MTENRFLEGDGWLSFKTITIGQVSYRVEVHHSGNGEAGSLVRLTNHSIDPSPWQGRVLTLQLNDGRVLHGFLSLDGAELLQAGAPT
jgi:hypothetical protein